MFVTQVGVSESRFVTVGRLETIHETTGKEFPVSGDAKLRKEHQLLKARMEAARLLAYSECPTCGVECKGHMHYEVMEPPC